MVSLHATIQDLDASEWNRLAPDSAFASYGWLLTSERCWLARAAPLYFALRRDGVLAGASVCYQMTSTPGVETLDDVLLGRLRSKANAVGVSFLPALVCGPASGYGWHIGVNPNTSQVEQDRIRTELLDAMEAEADRRGLRLSCVQTLETETSLRALLEERGYLESRNVPIAVLEIPWQSIGEYFAHLPPKQRRECRRERRRNRDSGVVVELEAGPEGDGRFRALLDSNARQHGASGLVYRPELLQEMRANMGSDALLLAARKQAAISGVHLVLRHGPTLAAFAIGVDSEVSADDFTYFELGYYSLIEYAIEHGVERIDFGRGMTDIKRRRGCRLVRSSVYTRVSGASRPLYSAWYRFASAWNGRKLAG